MRVPLTDKHVVQRLRANVRDPPLIAVDVDRPLDPGSPGQYIAHPARIYDSRLGGKDNVGRKP